MAISCFVCILVHVYTNIKEMSLIFIMLIEWISVHTCSVKFLFGYLTYRMLAEE